MPRSVLHTRIVKAWREVSGSVLSRALCISADFRAGGWSLGCISASLLQARRLHPVAAGLFKSGSRFKLALVGCMYRSVRWALGSCRLFWSVGRPLGQLGGAYWPAKMALFWGFGYSNQTATLGGLVGTIAHFYRRVGMALAPHALQRPNKRQPSAPKSASLQNQ